jgi:hypothetical protein
MHPGCEATITLVGIIPKAGGVSGRYVIWEVGDGKSYEVAQANI